MTCTWGCQFEDFVDLIDLHNLTIGVNCSNPSTPAVTFSMSTGYRAAADGPTLTLSDFQPIVIGVDGSGNQQFVCDLPAQTTTTVGPIAPGTEQQVSLDIGPAACAGGNNMNTICSRCGGSAYISFELVLQGTDSTATDMSQPKSSYYTNLGPSQSAPTLFPITCTQ